MYTLPYLACTLLNRTDIYLFSSDIGMAPVRLLLLCTLSGTSARHASFYTSARHACSPRLRQHVLVATDEGLKIGDRAKRWWSTMSAFVAAFHVPSLEEDDMPAAVTLNRRLDETRQNPQPSDWAELANLTWACQCTSSAAPLHGLPSRMAAHIHAVGCMTSHCCWLSVSPDSPGRLPGVLHTHCRGTCCEGCFA